MQKQTRDKPVGSGAPGPGRKRGIPNRATSDVKAIVLSLLQRNEAEAQAMFDKLRRSPKEWLRTYLRAASLIVPRIQVDAGTSPLVSINLGAAPITDAEQAARVYREIIGRPDLDLSGLRFAALEHQGNTAPAHAPVPVGLAPASAPENL